jgi:hypothetical protein
VARPTNAYINYYAGYAQDDLRINPNLTVNLGLRYEFEQGLQEKNDELTVGFDRDRAWPVQVPGLSLKGGLMYAGVDGYPTHQSDPSKTKFAPRAGFAWSVNPKTVVRGGYGLFWAPHQYPGIGATSLGTRGFTQRTDYVASTDGGLTPCAGCNIVNPFPSGLSQPTGSATGILTGAGGSVDFVDQFRKSAYVHQYSVDFQRELGKPTGGGDRATSALIPRAPRPGRQRRRASTSTSSIRGSRPSARPCSIPCRTRSSVTRPSEPSGISGPSPAASSGGPTRSSATSWPTR